MRERVRLRRTRVRLIGNVDYWSIYGSEVVFTAPKGYQPLNKSCVPIDESTFNFIKHNGGRVMRLIVTPSAEPGNWWLA